MLFGVTQRRGEIKTDIKLQLSGQDIASVENYTYLGMVLDDKLSFNAHLAMLHGNCSQKIYTSRKSENIKMNMLR